MTERRVELSGHRGARGLWPENTLAGFAGALRLGIDALELDVQLTADGVPVVTHDLTLDPDLVRGADGRWLEAPGPAVAALTLAELQRLDVGRARPGSAAARAHPRQAPADGQTIPTLDAVLRLVAGQPVRLDVELKTDPPRPERSADPARLAALALQAIAATGVARQATLRSFDWRGLRHAAAIAPDMPLCFLTETADAATLEAVREAAGGRAADWAPRFTGLTASLVDAAHGMGLRVKPWTVNRPDDMARLVAWGVDGFCTDDPDLARVALAQAGLAPPPPLAAA